MKAKSIVGNQYRSADPRDDDGLADLLGYDDKPVPRACRLICYSVLIAVVVYMLVYAFDPRLVAMGAIQ